MQLVLQGQIIFTICPYNDQSGNQYIALRIDQNTGIQNYSQRAVPLTTI